MFLQLLSIIVGASAATTAPVLLQTFPHEVLRNEVVTFKPEKNHHFSVEAPQNCGSGQLIDKTTREVKCQFTQVGAVQALLNVCDDKKTFCKPINLEIQVLARASGETEKLTKNENLNKELKAKLVPGFEIGTPEAIKAKALAKGRPVFLMISTDWCPPCNEAKEHLLTTKAFETATADWYKVYVDGDSLQAGDWDKVVPHRFYPSFVFLNPKFEEVARYTGSIRQADFAAWAKEVTALKGDPISALQKRVLARREGNGLQKIHDFMNGMNAAKRGQEETRLLLWAIGQDKGDIVNLLAAEAKLPNEEHELTKWKLSRLEEEQNKGGEDKKDLRIELYQRLLGQLIRRDGWALAWADFCEYDSKACYSQMTHVDARLRWLSERQGFSESEMASMMGEEYAVLAFVYETLGRKADEKAMAAKCVSEYEKLGKSSILKLSRSSQQGIISCLETVGDFAKAEAHLKPLIEVYPSEPTFLLRMARIQRKNKKPKEALEWVTKAEAKTYGYNWFSTQALKADLLLELKRPAEAKVVLDAALKQVPLDGSLDSRNQRTVARLRNAQAKVEARLKR
ncbi:MAG: thioredoxin family protein [Bdellovibrionales bacterium]|nr:thioredoxin family protein [Bdellovibrionales bacterium]